MLRADPRFEVALSRDRDAQVSLSERARMARVWKADALISIHANSNEDPRATGVEIYFQNQLAADEESMFLAARENGDATDPRDARADDVSTRGDLASILEDLKRSRSVKASFELSRILLEGWPSANGPRGSAPLRGGGSARGIRQAPFYVVSRGTTPAALVEVGFLSNPAESRRLLDSGYQSRIAEHLRDRLALFKETVDKDQGRNLKSADAI